MPSKDSTYRSLSDWELERWQEIVHICTSRPGGVEFGPQAKAVILGVARQMEHQAEEIENLRHLVEIEREAARFAREKAIFNHNEVIRLRTALAKLEQGFLKHSAAIQREMREGSVFSNPMLALAARMALDELFTYEKAPDESEAKE